MARTPRDAALLDALGARTGGAFAGTAWCVSAAGQDPCRGGASGGRWDDASFEVLYTALEPEGALAEMYFHLRRGQPVFPSRVRYHLHELAVALDRVLDLADLAALEALGVEPSRYGRLGYAGRAREYARTQRIGEAAQFLGFDALLVPNARRAGTNLVVFRARMPPGGVATRTDHGLVDWGDAASALDRAS